VSRPVRCPAPTGRPSPQLTTQDPRRRIGSNSHRQNSPYYIDSRGRTPVPPSFHNQPHNQSATPASSQSTYGPRSAVRTHYQPNPTLHLRRLNPLPPNMLTMTAMLLNSNGAVIHCMTAQVRPDALLVWDRNSIATRPPHGTVPVPALGSAANPIVVNVESSTPTTPTTSVPSTSGVPGVMTSGIQVLDVSIPMQPVVIEHHATSL
jgi:hypothetical protein